MLGLDDAGITDIPLRLLIAAVLTSLMVPILIGSYEDLSCSVAEDRAIREMGRISNAARAVLDADVGSSLEVHLDLRGFGAASFKEAAIGGPVAGGSDPSAYMLVFDFELLGRIVSVPDPPALMTGPDGMEALRVHSGEINLIATHRLVGGVHAAAFERA